MLIFYAPIQITGIEEGAPADVPAAPYQPYDDLRQTIIDGISGDQLAKAKKYLIKGK